MFWSCKSDMGEELEMVISIDAIRTGTGFDPTVSWPQPRMDEPAAEWEENLTPGRGVLNGLLLSCLLWAGVIAGIRTVVAFFV
jgi:hypothetical protein